MIIQTELQTLDEVLETIQILDENSLCSWKDANRIVETAGNWDTFEQNVSSSRISLRDERNRDN